MDVIMLIYVNWVEWDGKTFVGGEERRIEGCVVFWWFREDKKRKEDFRVWGGRKRRGINGF